MTVLRSTCLLLLALTGVVTSTARADAAEWFVAPGASGTGTTAAPFGRIQDAINVAQPGDTVTLKAGTYAESFHSVRNGASGLAIRVRAAVDRGGVIVTAAGRVITASHPYFTVEGLVVDGQYGLDDTVKVTSAASYFTLRNTEVRRSTHDLVDIDGPTGVLIDNCLIHHALNAANGRTDAHGIVAGPVQTLTIRNTEIHTFSGDGFQVDPGRSSPGWRNVTLDSVRIWLAPLPAAENGFAAGTVTGENAVDTKANATLTRATLTIRNMSAWGFRNGLIANMAAFNLKENISATLDRVTVFDSEIAFRLRGGGTATTGAWVTLKNAVVHDVTTSFRYEDNIQNLHIWNSTVGKGVTRAFQAASSTSTGLDVRNVLLLAATKPAEAAGASNLAVTEQSFVDAAHDNYHLALGSPAIDTGAALTSVTIDRDALKRPFGAGYDVGAYEWQPSDAAEVVVHAWNAPVVAGAWRIVPDATAAGGATLSHPDNGAATIAAPKTTPTDYFEVTVPVQAGRAYRLWLRGRADGDSPLNDSVYVQFSGAVSSAGTPLYPIGTSSAAIVTLEDCPGCGLHGWSWQDNGAGVEVLGAQLRFAVTGLQTIRIQTREDGVSIDQIVLSPVDYLNAAPGWYQNDLVILPQTS